MGESRRVGCVLVTSGLQPTPDMSLRRNNRRYVPFGLPIGLRARHE